MGMWFFSLICSLLAPLTMILFGFLWKTRPPRDINSFYGYRTAMSSKNQQTWFFAHACISRLWRRLGLATLVLSILVYGLGSLALAAWRSISSFSSDFCPLEAILARISSACASSPISIYFSSAMA